MQMRARRLGITGFLAALLFVGMTGCGKETVASAPPVASALAPSPGATNVAVNQAVTATFSQAMNSATINTSTFTLTGASGPVTGSVTYSAASVATFTPSANLAYNTVYTATITTGAANTLGIDTAANYTWTFTTMTPPPVVVSTIPANGATGVPATQALTATFNEAMSSATINGSLLPDRAWRSYSGCVTYNSTGFVATFTPSTNLAYGTAIQSYDYNRCTGLSGDWVSTSYSWTFTTGAPPLSSPIDNSRKCRHWCSSNSSTHGNIQLAAELHDAYIAGNNLHRYRPRRHACSIAGAVTCSGKRCYIYA